MSEGNTKVFQVLLGQIGQYRKTHFVLGKKCRVSPEFVVDDNFAHMWCSALAFCQKRFEGRIGLYKNHEPSGGLGCFTPDSFPVFDRFRDNVFVIADSNHGFKMIGVGKLVADELLGGKSALLEPFRFSRYAEGRLHPTSHSPFPWS